MDRLYLFESRQDTNAFMCLRHRLRRGFPRINTRAIEYHKLVVLANKKIFVDLFKASWDRSLGMELNYIDTWTSQLLCHFVYPINDMSKISL